MAIILNEPLTPLQKLTKARVQLQERKPFFSYLAMHLKFIENSKITDSMCINKKGELKYNPEYVRKLNEEEVIGGITHEVMHCALQHLVRKGHRLHRLFNISSDIVTNNLLVNDNVTLPKNSLIPIRNEYVYEGCELKNLHEKTSEEVYDELYRHLSKKYKGARKEIEKFLEESKNKGFDDHEYGSNGDDDDKSGSGNGNRIDGNGKSGNTPLDDEVDWGKLLVNAYAYAKSKGDVPLGMDRVIGKIQESFIDWKGLLYRYITSHIPVDYTYARPHKKSYSLGFYNPAIVKEDIDVYLAIDTSGSISPPELEEFLGEIVGIVNSFKSVNLSVIVCDCAIQGVYDIKHASKKDVIDKIKLEGGGGTSHIPVFDWLKENKPQAKLLIAFTDGYTDFPDDPHINTLWVLAGSCRASKKHFPFGKVI